MYKKRSDINNSQSQKKVVIHGDKELKVGNGHSLKDRTRGKYKNANKNMRPKVIAGEIRGNEIIKLMCSVQEELQ